MKISKEEYAFLCEQGIPYEGAVEGVGYACRGYETSVHYTNRSKTEMFYQVDTINICIATPTYSPNSPSAAMDVKIEADLKRRREEMITKMRELSEKLRQQSIANMEASTAKLKASEAARAAREAEAIARADAAAKAKAAAEKAAAQKAAAQKAETDRIVAREAEKLKEMSKDFYKAFVPVSTYIDRSHIEMQVKDIERVLADLQNQVSGSSSTQNTLRSVAEDIEKLKSPNKEKKNSPPLSNVTNYTEFATRILQFIIGMDKDDSRGAFNISKAVAALDKNAEPRSIGYCAKYVRLAIEAGGLSTEGRPGGATNYDVFLPKIGFSIVDSTGYVPKKGDIVVLKAFQGKNKYHQYGHIQMYNGVQWVSDFKQRDFWPGNDYRTYKPEYIIFRWK